MTAVVVGVGDVVGAACVQRFVQDGHRVHAVDEDEQALRACPDGVRTHRAGLVDEVALAQVAAGVGGPVDVLVLAHFALEPGTPIGTPMASWARVLTTNVLGPVAAVQALLPRLRAAEGACVVLLGSVDGTSGNPSAAAYSVSKGALVPLTHVLAHELGPLGVRVNLVARAAVAGSVAGGPLSAMERDAVRATPLGRSADPAEVAAAVAMVASSDATYVTGATLVVDGGRSGLTPGTA
ncbi:MULTISPECIES: SDR family NAD(P)-dependent oxidoreductase [unclassified Blastococcus]